MSEESSDLSVLRLSSEEFQGAHFATLREISDSARQASKLLHRKTPISPSDRVSLLELVETCQALAMALQQSYGDMVNEIVTEAIREVRGSMTDRVAQEATRRTLRDCIELTPYLLKLRRAI